MLSGGEMSDQWGKNENRGFLPRASPASHRATQTAELHFLPTIRQLNSGRPLTELTEIKAFSSRFQLKLYQGVKVSVQDFSS